MYEVYDLVCSYFGQTFISTVIRQFCRNDEKSLKIHGFNDYFNPVNELISRGLFTKDPSLLMYVKKYISEKEGERSSKRLFFALIDNLESDDTDIFVSSFHKGIISKTRFKLYLGYSHMIKSEMESFLGLCQE